MARTCSIAELRQEFEVLHVSEDTIVRPGQTISVRAISYSSCAVSLGPTRPVPCDSGNRRSTRAKCAAGLGFCEAELFHRSSSWFGGHRYPLDANCWCRRLARVPRTVLALPQIWVSARCISGLGPASIERQVTGMAGDRRLLEEFR